MEPEEIAKHITEDIYTNCGLKNSIKPKIPGEKPFRNEDLNYLAAHRASQIKLPVPSMHPYYNPISYANISPPYAPPQPQPISQPKVIQETKAQPTKHKINLPGKRKISL